MNEPKKSFDAPDTLLHNGKEMVSAGWEIVLTNDISAGGLAFGYNKEIKVGTLLDFVFNFQTTKMAIKSEKTNPSINLKI